MTKSKYCVWSFVVTTKNHPQVDSVQFTKSCKSALFSPSGNHIVTTSLDDKIRIYDMSSQGVLLCYLRGPAYPPEERESSLYLQSCM